ncbi:MAG: hypothetical protein R6X17_00165 [Candidatus Competibacteraceae bacterium]
MIPSGSNAAFNRPTVAQNRVALVTTRQLYLLFEHQSYLDPALPVQLLGETWAGCI